MTGFSDLSNELVTTVLCHLDYKSLLACASVSRVRSSSTLGSRACARFAAIFTISFVTLWG